MDIKKKNKVSLSRKDFLGVVAKAAALMSLPVGGAKQVMAAVEADNRPSVIWLHFQECTGCSESLLRASHPKVAELILDLISLDYHETLMAASGYQAEKSLHDAMAKGNYILVVEGSIPMKDEGIYCKIAGKTALELIRETSRKANAIVAIGSCASWGGVQSIGINPTGASGVKDVIKDKLVINLPGCPAQPDIFLSTVLYLLTFKKAPKLDKQGRPLLGYGTTLHDHCERRSHFDNGRFVTKYGDHGHQHGWCLYLMGCKGPVTHASCNAQTFNDVGVWPVGTGHPCAGCTEKGIGFTMPIHEPPKITSELSGKPEVLDKNLVDSYARVGEAKERGAGTLVGAGVAGAAIGAAVGFAGAMAAKLPANTSAGDDNEKEQSE